jgi:alpha-D-ribose 1-methylphosphonate 5-triphosphate synthase subunit PhnL
MILQIERLEKTFEIHVLDGRVVRGLAGVSFDVDDGEFVAIVGDSGSGKSSLLKCIYRTYAPDGGHIWLHTEGGRVDLATCADREMLEVRRHSIGYASQFLREIPRIPAVDVVARPLIERGTDPAAARGTARELLEQLLVPADLWDAYPATFSGGERQRVNLARAIAPRPRLLLVDEPTSALDVATREAALSLLESYLGGETTVIGVFHNRAVVNRLADRVVVLDDGHLEAVLSADAYAREVLS